MSTPGTAQLLLVCTLVVVSGAAGGPATAGAGRGTTLDYSAPAPGASTPRLAVDHDDCTIDDPAPGCVVTPIRPADRFVAVEIRDDVGGPLVAGVVVVESRNGDFDFLGYVCGSSMEVPLPVPRGYDYLEVHVLEGTCAGSTTPSVVTSGVIGLWFSGRRFR